MPKTSNATVTITVNTGRLIAIADRFTTSSSGLGNERDPRTASLEALCEAGISTQRRKGAETQRDGDFHSFLRLCVSASLRSNETAAAFERRDRLRRSLLRGVAEILAVARFGARARDHGVGDGEPGSDQERAVR